MIAESGPGRIIEVDRDGTHPERDPAQDRTSRLPHRHPAGAQTGQRALPRGARRARTRSSASTTRQGQVVWEFEPHSKVYSAIRLASGNTLIGCGDGHRVIEVDPAGQDRLVGGRKGFARHHAGLGDDGRAVAQRQHGDRQLPRRPRQSANHRSHARQTSRLDVPAISSGSATACQLPGCWTRLAEPRGALLYACTPVASCPRPAAFAGRGRTWRKRRRSTAGPGPRAGRAPRYGEGHRQIAELAQLGVMMRKQPGRDFHDQGCQGRQHPPGEPASRQNVESHKRASGTVQIRY